MADLIENCRRHRRGMIGLLTVLGALLLGARAQEEEFRLVGSDVTLVPKYTGDLREIKWTFNDRILVEIVLKPEEEIIHHLTNDRTTINKTNGALTIRNLNRGNSGLYKAEVTLVDNSIKVTEIRLTVSDCPDQPIIYVQSTEDQFVVSCKSFSPYITYEWFNPTRSVSESQLYTVPKKSGTLTCVVDNKVCNKSSSINFYIPDQPEVKSVGNEVTLVPQYIGDPSEIIWKVNGDNLVEMELKPQVDFIFHRLEDRATISHTDGSLTIWDLTMEDSGVYTAVVLVNNDYYYTEIRLEYSPLSGWIIAILVFGLFLNFIPIFLLLWYCCCKESRDPSVWWSIIGKVSGVLFLNPIIIAIFLLWYYCCKEPSDLPRWIIACIVFEVMSSITIPIYIFFLWYYFYKRSRDPSCVTFILIVVVWVLSPFTILILIAIFLLWYCCCRRVKADKDDDVKKGIALVSMGENVDKIGRKKPSTQLEMAIFKPQDSDIERAEESERCITVMFWNYVISPIDESEGLLEGPPKRIQSLPLTIYGVQTVDDEIFTAEAVMSDGKEGTFTEGKEISVIIQFENDGKTLYISNAKNVKKLVCKKDGVTMFKCAGSSLKLHASNIKLERESVTVYDAKGKESYIVFFRLEEPPESMSICSITFHPIKMTGKDPITWEKDSQLVNIDGNRIKCDPNGDLTIYNAASKDKGKYTVQCKDNELDQEFILH